jgi:5-methylcytosine-specific restriction endonuclease McrA
VLKEVVLVLDPHLQSRGALLALRRKLLVQDTSTHGYWLRFRQTFLTKWLEQGPLRCAYCGRGPLHIDPPDDSVATIDHITPLSRGGAKFDEQNLAVACLLCNGKKADKIEGWLPQS